MLYGENSEATTADYPVVSTPVASLEYYVLENCRGTVPEIGDPADKDSTHAPKGSSYLRLDGYFDGKAVSYRVYLGGGPTDFNVRRNREYLYNITIHGANTADCRVSMSEVTATTLAESYPFGETPASVLTFTSANDDENAYTLTFELIAGSAKVVIDGAEHDPGTVLPLMQGSGTRHLSVSLKEAAVGPLTVSFTVSDSRGQRVSCTLSTTVRPIYPITVSISKLSRPYAYCTAISTLTVGEEDYTGNFTVECLSVSGGGTFSYGGQTLTPDMRWEITSGSHQVDYQVGNFVGEVRLKLRITDRFGQTAETEMVQKIGVLWITIQVNLVCETNQVAKPGGGYLFVSSLNATYKCNYPLPHDITIEYSAVMTQASMNTSIDTTLSVSTPLAAGTESVTHTIWYRDTEVPDMDMNGNIISDGYIIQGVELIDYHIPSSHLPNIRFNPKFSW